jgi:hypothetical protein
MQAFQDVLSDCGLEDLGYSGEIFTWRRGRIWECLDRAVADGAWTSMHPARFYNIWTSSDRIMDPSFWILSTRLSKCRDGQSFAVLKLNDCAKWV